jgi:tryptophan-rich sensory protein
MADPVEVAAVAAVRQEWILIMATTAFVFFPFTKQTYKTRVMLDGFRRTIPWIPRSSIFNFIWFFVYICVVTNIDVWILREPVYLSYYTAVFYVFMINIALNKVWYALFFTNSIGYLLLAAIDAFLVFGTAMAYFVLQILDLAADPTDTWRRWIIVIFLIPYLLWSLFVLFMSAYIVYKFWSRDMRRKLCTLDKYVP